MERRYDVLFSIELRHQGYDDKPVPGLSLRPTAECHYHLQRHNMLFKQNDKGGLIIMEKLAAGITSLQPTRPFDGLLEFTFLLENKNTALLGVTEPYAGSAFQSQVANSFCFYFDNLDAGLHFDTMTELTESGDATNVNDIFFVYPEKWSVPSAAAAQVKIMELKPGGKTTVYTPSPPGAVFINVVLPQGAYRIESGTPVAVTERALVHPQLRQNDALGVIRIFKNADTDYSYIYKQTNNSQKGFDR